MGRGEVDPVERDAGTRLDPRAKVKESLLLDKLE